MKGLGFIQRHALELLASRPAGCISADLDHLTSRSSARQTLNGLARRGAGRGGRGAPERRPRQQGPSSPGVRHHRGRTADGGEVIVTGPDHYREAERLLEAANTRLAGNDAEWLHTPGRRAELRAEAAVHATLAHAAATADLFALSGQEGHASAQEWREAVTS